MRDFSKTASLLALLALMLLAAGSLPASAAITGSLSTPSSSGVISGDKWLPPTADDGFLIEWVISDNMNGSWHYLYRMLDQSGAGLTPLTSHLIIQLSENIEESDLFNYGGDIDNVEFGVYGPHPSNPSFPVGKSISGIKFNMGGAQTVVEFDCTRKPMWGDFYAKGGKESYAYNADLGVIVANPNDYLGAPVDENGRELAKILTPDTIVPEPTAIFALAGGVLGILGRARRKRS